MSREYRETVQNNEYYAVTWPDSPITAEHVTKWATYANIYANVMRIFMHRTYCIWNNYSSLSSQDSYSVVWRYSSQDQSRTLRIEYT